MSDKELTHEERAAIARAPITRGILATNYSAHDVPGMAHAGNGERPSAPVFGASGRIVGTRAVRMSSGGDE